MISIYFDHAADDAGELPVRVIVQDRVGAAYTVDAYLSTHDALDMAGKLVSAAAEGFKVEDRSGREAR